jgi:hypothetical protein
MLEGWAIRLPGEATGHWVVLNFHVKSSVGECDGWLFGREGSRDMDFKLSIFLGIVSPLLWLILQEWRIFSIP